MVRLTYREGDWFAVPLGDGTWGVGVVARVNPRGVLLGYFFGPPRTQPPSTLELAELEPWGAVLVAKFGHLGLQRGQWPIIGQLAGWRREKWPMPKFGRYEELTGRHVMVTYADLDPNRVVREDQVGADVGSSLPSDDLFGQGAIEEALADLLRST